MSFHLRWIIVSCNSAWSDFVDCLVFILFLFIIFNWKIILLLYIFDLILFAIDYLYRRGMNLCYFIFKSWFCLLYLVYQGSLNFIIYFYFPILKELMVYFSYCFIIINNRLLVVKCYSSLVVSGFSRNEFNSCSLFNFYFYFICFYLVLRLRGISSLFYFYNFYWLFSFVDFMVIFNLIMLKFYLLFCLFVL